MITLKMLTPAKWSHTAIKHRSLTESAIKQFRLEKTAIHWQFPRKLSQSISLITQLQKYLFWVISSFAGLFHVKWLPEYYVIISSLLVCRRFQTARSWAQSGCADWVTEAGNKTSRFAYRGQHQTVFGLNAGHQHHSHGLNVTIRFVDNAKNSTKRKY